MPPKDHVDTAADRPREDTPPPLVVAASLTAVEGLVLVLLAVAEAAHLTAGRVTMNVTTTGFFLLLGAALLLCAWGLHRLATWARSPVVLAQLIALGVAWSFRGGERVWVGVALAVTAAIVLAGVFHPASTQALVDDPTGTAGSRDDD